MSAYLLALPGKRYGMAHAVFLAAQRKAVLGLAVAQVGGKIEIETVAHPVGGR